MSAQPVSVVPIRTVPVNASSIPPQSFWERVSTWVSENKAIVYTVGAVAVVATGAGVVYYLSEPNKGVDGRDDSRRASEDKKKSKKERRKAKKEVDEPGRQETPTVDVAPR